MATDLLVSTRLMKLYAAVRTTPDAYSGDTTMQSANCIQCTKSSLTANLRPWIGMLSLLFKREDTRTRSATHVLQVMAPTTNHPDIPASDLPISLGIFQHLEAGNLTVSQAPWSRFLTIEAGQYSRERRCDEIQPPFVYGLTDGIA